ncbi:glucosamine-6-phosphate deaminase [Algivirga pacifica]|uniref:Glucosamine-6-phosphate deaminase n=1 Tax=Algivirga pacifica TaxID=1162670 RepID=A0ABP9DJM5_9BACT
MSVLETYQLSVNTFDSKEVASKKAAARIAELIQDRDSKGENTILGLATGSSPLGVYAELIRLHKEEGLSFQNVITFNLDEYLPMDANSAHSYVYFMQENLFKHIDIKPENIHIPDGTLSQEQVDSFCQEYEQKIAAVGGIDIQLLGIGRTGHIGFNEPPSSLDSLTRQVILHEITRIDAAPGFGGIEHVPSSAITMGVGTIMKAKEVIMLAWGESKAAIVKEMIQGEISEQVPATFLQYHANTQVYLDKTAASAL